MWCSMVYVLVSIPNSLHFELLHIGAVDMADIINYALFESADGLGIHPKSFIPHGAAPSVILMTEGG